MKKMLLTWSVGLLPLLAFSETKAKINAADETLNPYLFILLGIILVLMLVIMVLNYSISSLVVTNHELEQKKKSVNPKTLLSLALIFLSVNVFGQEQQVVDDGLMFGMTSTTFYALICAIGFEIIVIIFQVLTIRGLVQYYTPAIPREVKVKRKREFWSRFNRSVSIEKEETILFEHEYDGIRELDNNLPPWWKYGFYITIVFSVIYLIHYHITQSGPLQHEEYLAEMAEGKKEVEEYLKKAADNVDENTVEYTNDASEINEGKLIYHANCVACHGPLGEGKVGPNLTDEYWLHGGSIKDVFISVKYGWPDKGMKSWKEDLTPKQVSQVSSFIYSLKGSNPPNALPPKGDIYKEKNQP